MTLKNALSLTHISRRGGHCEGEEMTGGHSPHPHAPASLRFFPCDRKKKKMQATAVGNCECLQCNLWVSPYQPATSQPTRYVVANTSIKGDDMHKSYKWTHWDSLRKLQCTGIFKNTLLFILNLPSLDPRLKKSVCTLEHTGAELPLSQVFYHSGRWREWGHIT